MLYFFFLNTAVKGSLACQDREPHGLKNQKKNIKNIHSFGSIQVSGAIKHRFSKTMIKTHKRGDKTENLHKKESYEKQDVS